jgi:hypothetical protein
VGFLRKISLDAHAQGLSKNFGSMRKESYSCIVANGRNAKEAKFPLAKTALAGEADLCMKGVQCLIAMAFVREMHYVRNNDDADMLMGRVIHYGWPEEQDAVSRYVLQFKEFLHNSPDLVANMASEIVRYILGKDADPWQSMVLMNMTSRTLAPFPSATRYIIASEFRDLETARHLQVEVEAISVAVSSPLSR